ncbi:MAG TPA: sialidase family protein, partial [Chthoniobacterales bacterium]
MQASLEHAAVRKERALASIGSALLIGLAGVLFVAALVPSQIKATSAANSPIAVNAAAAFAFSAPLQLAKPVPNPALFFIADAEPEIKVDLFGNIYVTAINGVPGGTDLWKSTDSGASFKYLGQPDGLQDKCLSPTPECFAAGGADDATDVSSGGYLYVTSLYIGSITVATSMDGGTGGTQPGQAWQVQPVGSQVPADDRQWIAAYGPQTLYLTMRQAPGTGRLFFFKSTDAGKTFVPTTANPLTTIVSREANLVVDKYSGNIYTAFTTNGSPNQITLLRSTDGGNTWSTAAIYTGPTTTSLENAFTILAVDSGGNLYLTFSQCTKAVAPSTQRTNCHAYLMSTANPAAATPAWTGP